MCPWGRIRGEKKSKKDRARGRFISYQPEPRPHGGSGKETQWGRAGMGSGNQHHPRGPRRPRDRGQRWANQCLSVASER